MKKKEEMGKSVKTIQEEFGEAPMTLEERRTVVALERIADSANALVNFFLLCLHKYFRYILYYEGDVKGLLHCCGQQDHLDDDGQDQDDQNRF